MSYSEGKYQTRVQVPAASAASLSTATASGAVANTDVIAQLPKYNRRSQITAIRLRCTTAPNAASTAMKLSFLNGTNTFGTAILTTATSDQFVDGVITSAANAVFAADGQPTANLNGTATASGAANGAFDVYLEVQELPA